MPSRIICFVCGSLGGEYQLRSRPCDGYAYFPFLEHHDPPKGSRIPGSDGVVDSCRVCYAFLTQQWETYERTETPAIKRLYWLKRLDDGQFTGAEMKLQGEYMAQVMGLQYQPSCGDNCAPGSPDSRDGSGAGTDSEVHVNKTRPLPDEDDRVLDLSVSVKSDSSAKTLRKLHAAGEKIRKESTKSKNSSEEFTFACYACGVLIEGVAAKNISIIPRSSHEPFFPFLTKVTPPRAAVPISEKGVCQVCEHCFQSLYHQWLTYEHHGTPNSARIFKVSSQFFSNDSNIALGAMPESLSAIGEICYLCGKLWSASKICSLYTAPVIGKEDHMYFPFIRDLKRPNGSRPLNPDSSVLVCLTCFSNLQEQWHHYESQKVPSIQRRYSLLPPLSTSSAMTAVSHHQSFDADVKFESLFIKMENETKPLIQPLSLEIAKSPALTKTLVQSQSASFSSSNSQSITTETSRQQTGDIKPHSSTILSIPHPLQQAGERPKKVCFLCGEKCLASKAEILYSYPIRHETKNAGVQVSTIPFFPFLASYSPAAGAEPMTEEGTVSSCNYCFYSLLNQWRDFEETKGVTERNRWLRKYTLNEFVCYVCGLMVPRKKMRTLEVEKFLFLKEHKAPPNALVMWGGEVVGACGSCHYSLSHQFAEFERLGLPLELRKYNWTVQHHAEDTGSEAHDTNLRVSAVAGLNEDSNLSLTGADDSNHYSPQSSRAVMRLISPAQTAGKMLAKSALTLASGQTSLNNSTVTSSNSLTLNSSRMASFATALRNLAYQIKEPPGTVSADEASNHSLPSSFYQSSAKRTSASMTLSGHRASPVVTAAPPRTAGSFSSHHDQERSQSSSVEPLIKPDYDQQEEGSLQGKEESSLPKMSGERLGNSDTLLSSQPFNPYSRSFHAFRSEEEELIRQGLALHYSTDPAVLSVAAYHPALLQQSSAYLHGSERLSNSLLLDQYRLMPATYLPFSAAGLVSPHSMDLGMHTMLAAAHQYPSAVFHPQYLSLGQPTSSPHLVTMLDRGNTGDPHSDHKNNSSSRAGSVSREATSTSVRETNSSSVVQDVKKENSSPDDYHRGRNQETSLPVSQQLPSPECPTRNGYHRQTSSATTHFLSADDSPAECKTHSWLQLENSNIQSRLTGFQNLIKTERRLSPPQGLTLKSTESHSIPSHWRSLAGLDSNQQSPSSWPLSIKTTSFLHLQKSKEGSETAALFRPFVDTNEVAECPPAGKPNSSVELSVATREETLQVKPPLSPISDSLPVSFSCTKDRTEKQDIFDPPRENVPSAEHKKKDGVSLNRETSTESRHHVSKLDAEAARAKRRRKRGHDSDDSDLEKEEEKQSARLTLIGRSTPIPLDASPRKVELLEHLGLTTWIRKKELNMKKEIRRRRQLRLSSVSPVQHDVLSSSELLEDNCYSANPFTDSPVPVSEDFPQHIMDSQDKEEFVAKLGLTPVLDQPGKDEKTINQGDTEREQVSSKHADVLAEDKRRHHSSSLIFVTRPPSLINRDSPPIKVTPTASDVSNNLNFLHLASTASSLQPSIAHPDTGSVSFSSASPRHHLYPWPGVNGVLDSYLRYREEQLAETQTLQEHCQRLQSDRSHLEHVAQRISSQMSVSCLVAETQKLQAESNHYQETIHQLTDTVNHLR